MVRRSLLALALATCVVAGCRDPTQITLQITTDATCIDVSGTAISAAPERDIELRPASTTTTQCTGSAEGANIGSLVLIPADREDGPVSVKVAMGLGIDVERCVNPPYEPECIIARRALSFIEHTPLTLPVQMSVDCKGVFCDTLTTCVDGGCVDATVDPQDCIEPSDDCRPGTSAGGGGAGGAGGAGGGGGAAGVGGAGGGTPLMCGAPSTENPIVITLGGGMGSYGLVSVAGDRDMCTWAVAYRQEDEVCAVTVAFDGMLGAPMCTPATGITAVDVGVVGPGNYVVAAWSQAGNAVTVTNLNGLSDTTVLTASAPGALAVRTNEIFVVNPSMSGQLGWVMLDGALDAIDNGVLGSGGGSPSAAYAGSEVVAGWVTGSNQGLVARFDPSLGVGTPTPVAASAQVAIGSHWASDVAGIIAPDAGNQNTLARWGPSGGLVAGTSSAYGGLALTGPDVVGVLDGWVAGFVTGNVGRLTRFDANTNAVAVGHIATANAINMAVAAIDDHLGVIWTNGLEVHFRRTQASLDGLAP